MRRWTCAALVLALLCAAPYTFAENRDVADFLSAFPLDCTPEEAREIFVKELGVAPVDEESETQTRFHSGYGHGLTMGGYPVRVEFIHTPDHPTILSVCFWVNDHESRFSSRETETWTGEEAARSIREAFALYERIAKETVARGHALQLGVLRVMGIENSERKVRGYNYPLTDGATDLAGTLRAVGLDKTYHVVYEVDGMEANLMLWARPMDGAYAVYCDVWLAIYANNLDASLRGTFTWPDGPYRPNKDAESLLLFSEE